MPGKPYFGKHETTIGNKEVSVYFDMVTDIEDGKVVEKSRVKEIFYADTTLKMNMRFVSNKDIDKIQKEINEEYKEQ